MATSWVGTDPAPDPLHGNASLTLVMLWIRRPIWLPQRVAASAVRLAVCMLRQAAAHLGLGKAGNVCNFRRELSF